MLKKDTSGIIYCFNKMCESTDCEHNQIHTVADNETIYQFQELYVKDSKGNCKNKTEKWKT